MPAEAGARRLRSIRRKTSFAAFERLPRRVGWKYEYYDGKAHITPNKVFVTLRLDLKPRRQKPVEAVLPPVTPEDARSLEPAFLAAFAQSPDYPGYPTPRFKKSAAEYFGRFTALRRGLVDGHDPL